MLLLIVGLMNELLWACVSQQWSAAADRWLQTLTVSQEAVSHSDTPIRSRLRGSGQVGSPGYEQNGKTTGTIQTEPLINTSVTPAAWRFFIGFTKLYYISDVVLLFLDFPRSIPEGDSDSFIFLIFVLERLWRTTILPWSSTSRWRFWFNQNTWCHFPTWL